MAVSSAGPACPQVAAGLAGSPLQCWQCGHWAVSGPQTPEAGVLGSPCTLYCGQSSESPVVGCFCQKDPPVPGTQPRPHPVLPDPF